MIIWLVNPGEPLPIDNNQRLFRTGKLAYSIKKNNEIIWFSSKFNHFKKEFRNKDEDEFEGIKYYFIKSIGYKNNLSIKRLIDHIILGFNLFFKAFSLKKPDLVITSYPPIETSFLIMIYCKIKRVKLICDVRDLWPYTFQNLFKKKIYKIICNISTFPWVILSKIIFKKTKLITISDGFSNWLQRYSKKKVDRFYLSYERKINKISSNKFKDLNILKDDFIVCFVGNFSRVKFNFNFILDASEEIYNISSNIKFIFCGDLKNMNESYKKKYKNIFLYDWIDKDEVRRLLSISQIGLAPYNDLWDFNLSIPNKISEYLCYELPVLSSLKGDSYDLINKYNCGINYDVSNRKEFLKNIEYYYQNKEAYSKIKNGAIQASKNFYDKEVLTQMEKIIFN